MWWNWSVSNKKVTAASREKAVLKCSNFAGSEKALPLYIHMFQA
jgi:hypothetical protein